MSYRSKQNYDYQSCLSLPFFNDQMIEVNQSYQSEMSVNSNQLVSEFNPLAEFNLQTNELVDLNKSYITLQCKVQKRYTTDQTLHNLDSWDSVGVVPFFLDHLYEDQRVQLNNTTIGSNARDANKISVMKAALLTPRWQYPPIQHSFFSCTLGEDFSVLQKSDVSLRASAAAYDGTDAQHQSYVPAEYNYYNRCRTYLYDNRDNLISLHTPLRAFELFDGGNNILPPRQQLTISVKINESDKILWRSEDEAMKLLSDQLTEAENKLQSLGQIRLEQETFRDALPNADPQYDASLLASVMAKIAFLDQKKARIKVDLQLQYDYLKQIREGKAAQRWVQYVLVPKDIKFTYTAIKLPTEVSLDLEKEFKHASANLYLPREWRTVQYTMTKDSVVVEQRKPFMERFPPLYVIATVTRLSQANIGINYVYPMSDESIKVKEFSYMVNSQRIPAISNENLDNNDPIQHQLRHQTVMRMLGQDPQTNSIGITDYIFKHYTHYPFYVIKLSPLDYTNKTLVQSMNTLAQSFHITFHSGLPEDCVLTLYGVFQYFARCTHECQTTYDNV